MCTSERRWSVKKLKDLRERKGRKFTGKRANPCQGGEKVRHLVAGCVSCRKSGQKVPYNFGSGWEEKKRSRRVDGKEIL